MNVRTHPYLNVSERVKRVVQPLLRGSDEYHRTHEARLARTVELIVKMNPTGRLLELGTSGFIPLALKELLPDLEVVVTDFEWTRGSDGKKMQGLGNKKLKLRTLCVDLESDALPVADGYFDFVLCGEVIEHMEVDPMFMLSEVNRVTRDGGRLLVTTPNVLSSRGLYKIIHGIEPYFYMQYHQSREMYRHNYEYTAKSLQAMLRCAGYDGPVWTEDLFEDPIDSATNQMKLAGVNVANVGDNILASCIKTSGVLDRHPVGFYV